MSTSTQRLNYDLFVEGKGEMIIKLHDRNLSIEMEGEDVRLLQRELRRLGFDVPDWEAEVGFFGKRIREAVALLVRSKPSAGWKSPYIRQIVGN